MSKSQGVLPSENNILQSNENVNSDTYTKYSMQYIDKKSSKNIERSNETLF